ncbi:DUF4262 domain-containing protein [Chitinophaga sp. CC14]|uniref:DUF4262 domain-containing protein n=1 Tax=Chitinophaga sp. CC14 TaxID=3029199 RepID=UPI003B7CC74C
MRTKPGLSIRDQQLLTEYGWYCHLERDEKPHHYPYGINIHTHGIQENFNHPDLQICFDINLELALNIFDRMVENIKSGAKYEPDKSYNDVLANGYNILIITAAEGVRRVLRIILPDASGGLNNPDYVRQISLQRPRRNK